MLNHVSVSTLLSSPPKPVPWVCDGLVARGALTVLAGEAGQGKSWLALGMAKGVAEGRIVAGIPCVRGKVLYIDAENGEVEMSRRARAMGVRGPVEFGFSSGLFDFETNGPYLSHLLLMEKPDLVILDGFRSLWQGDENDSRAVTQALSLLKQTVGQFNAGCILLHHLNKLGGYRGSGAIKAEPEILINLKGEDGNVKVLEWEKCRIGPAPDRHKFILSSEPNGSVVLRTASSLVRSS